MEVIRTVVGYLSENCYIVKDNNKCLIIDPGDEADKIIESVGDSEVLAVLITHAHFDHIGALDDIVKKYDVPVYYHNVNNELYYKKLINVDNKKYIIDNFKFEVIYVPGHRNDSVIYYFYENDIMFTGDFLFYLSVGRTDLEYGDYEEMIESIKKIKKYNDNIEIYPGHSSSTKLGFEKKYNDFLNV